jgi:hypothetical protein
MCHLICLSMSHSDKDEMDPRPKLTKLLSKPGSTRLT